MLSESFEPWFMHGDSKPSLSLANLPPPVNGLCGRELVGDLDRVASQIDVGASERRKLPLTVWPNTECVRGLQGHLCAGHGQDEVCSLSQPVNCVAGRRPQES